MFDAVFVCTGNRARSPLAAALFRRYAGDVDVRVRSLGTLDLEGLLALPDAVAAARELDVDLRQHRSRGLRGVDLSGADLVLGFEPLHVRAAVDEAGARPARTFLLGEFAALVGSDGPVADPVACARSLVADAAERRTASPLTAAAAIEDPLGKPIDQMHATAAAIDRLVFYLAGRLFGETAGGAGHVREGGAP